MSELVLVLGVIVLTAAVLIWLLFVSQKWLKFREQLMSQFGEATANPAPRMRVVAGTSNAVPERRREAQKAAA